MALTITDRFRYWTAALPDADAVVRDKVRLTYDQLWRRSQDLAASLALTGLQRGDVVVIAVRDPVEHIVGLLATLLAGGAYLAVEQEVPPERLRLMLEDSRPALVLTGPDEPVDGRIIAGVACLSTAAQEGRDDTRERAELPSLEPEDLASVFFTSGSTGRPKGVPLHHRGVTRLFDGTGPMALPPGARMAHAANVMFDAATLEIWGPLLQGGTVVCLSKLDLLDPAALRRQVRRNRIDSLFLTTALFREIACRDPSLFSGLDVLFVGGEAMDLGSASAVVAAGAPKRFFNLYGPTETTTLASGFDVLALPAQAQVVPIGYAVPSTHLHLLDDDLKPVAPGQEGELYVGGDGVGLGYLRRPGLTAGRFLPDPCGVKPGARMYRTGDSARVLPDGAHVYCGRRDRQVKLRGHRVEPEEIESVISSHPLVTSCAVDAVDSPSAGLSLVAYVACPPTLSSDDVITWLRSRLPGYMTPSSVRTLPAMPLTTNGKVDYSRLRGEHGVRAAGPCSSAASITEGHGPRHGTRSTAHELMEDAVADVWAGVLGVEKVERERNFFDLGGTSLLLMEVQIRLQEVAGKSPEIRELLEHPTVSAQATLLAGQDPSGPPLEDQFSSGPIRDRLRRRREVLAQQEGET